MKSPVLKTIITILIIYLVICAILYFIQEKLIFFPEKLSKDYKYVFKQGDTLITLRGQPHNGISENPEYLEKITRILNGQR